MTLKGYSKPRIRVREEKKAALFVGGLNFFGEISGGGRIGLQMFEWLAKIYL